MLTASHTTLFVRPNERLQGFAHSRVSHLKRRPALRVLLGCELGRVTREKLNDLRVLRVHSNVEEILTCAPVAGIDMCLLLDEEFADLWVENKESSPCTNTKYHRNR